ncbi:MAG TPA: class I adenylate-forming enzyme family protein [Burkholderiales bacterium]|jgi:acyl-CoA synthetase (AMP-forming)/AMP-acid ligase II
MERPRFDPARSREFIARGWWREDTLPAWISTHAQRRARTPALAWSDGSLTWAQLQDRVLRTAAGLRRRGGVRRGDVIAVQLPNSPEFVVAYLALCRLGAVMCPLHMPYRQAEIETLMRHGGARLAICLADRKGLFGGAGVAFEEIPGDEMLEANHPVPEAADAFLLLYTSGTTAAPKGVPHPYRTMLANARLGAPEHGLDSRDRILSAAPFSHLYGLYSLHCAWAVGACTVLLPAFKPDELGMVVQDQKPTALWTAPAHLAACRAAYLFDQRDWSSLKLAIVSGSSAPPELMHFLNSRLKDCATSQLWGMTELQAGLYTRPGDAAELSATTSGRASPGTEVRLSAEGEIQVRGVPVFAGYHENEEANRQAFTADGWFRSGDLGRMDAAGNVAVTGRTKDVINRGGVKFNPAEVEVLLDAHPKILQSAIVPMPDAVLGEKACAFVALRTPVDISLEEVVKYLLEKNIAKNKLPEKLVVVAEMPLTPTRKIIKGKLKLP